jgi:photosynthetic reaction center cytochrome c subunit
LNPFVKATGAFVVILLVGGVILAYERTSVYQQGAPGLGMDMIKTNKELEETVAANVVPAPLPPSSPGGQLAVDAYKNVRVLGHLSSADFTRLMTAMTIWVAPDQGCAYCHAPQRDEAGNAVKDEDGYVVADLNNMGSDELYTKRVARRMLQMTMHINQDWQPHVKATGVTCYTCHRGQPVPSNIWFNGPKEADVPMGELAYQNRPDPKVAYASLPTNTFETFLRGDSTNANIRVISTDPLPAGANNRASVKQTEWTYGLMMHMSGALGVNCTYCHNSRSMAEWSTSPPQRTTAWYGIRMVRDLNGGYVEPLQATFPKERLGPEGDAPKINCATCHKGAFKPLLGVSMLRDYAVLAEAKPQPAKSPVEPVPAPEGAPANP